MKDDRGSAGAGARKRDYHQCAQRLTLAETLLRQTLGFSNIRGEMPRPIGERATMPDVLLVDGDDHYREVLAAKLIALGFSVMCFAKGPSLLEALSSGMEAKVVLLEWALPEMSGLELLETLRKCRIGLPVVFLTAYSQVEQELQALDHGAVDFVDEGPRGRSTGPPAAAHHEQPAPNPTPGDAGGGALWRTCLAPSMARALWLDQDVGLTIAEFNVVTLLMSSKGEIQTYRTIYDTVHFAGFIAGSGDRGYTTNVRSFVEADSEQVPGDRSRLLSDQERPACRLPIGSDRQHLKGASSRQQEALSLRCV